MRWDEKIFSLRTRLELTQRQVAEAIGVSVQTVSNWETGSSTPKLTPKQMRALCRVLQCSLDDLANALDTDEETEE